MAKMLARLSHDVDRVKFNMLDLGRVPGLSMIIAP